MRRMLSALLLLFAGAVCAAADSTNDFYDGAPTVSLGEPQLVVAGEIANPGPVALSTLPLRSVVVKETRSDGDSAAFVGAYRYDGYSLDDILNERAVRKKNGKEFPRVIDLYVEIANAAGDRVVLSWGEIYYPCNRHQILIATQVARIVPSKTKELWPLPDGPQLVVGPDLVTERTIGTPTTITVRSYPRSFSSAVNITPLYSPVIRVISAVNVQDSITATQRFDNMLEYPAVFYGRGKGIHGISRFRGVPLKAALGARWPLDRANLRQGLVAIAALDGYRSVFSYGEIFNRNDQNEALLVPRPAGQEGGAFSLFMPADFFSDRAVKAISEIRLDLLDDLAPRK